MSPDVNKQYGGSRDARKAKYFNRLLDKLANTMKFQCVGNKIQVKYFD